MKINSKNIRAITKIIFLALLCSTSGLAQKNYSDYLMVNNKEIELSYEGGIYGFFKDMGRNLNYPPKASKLHSQALALIHIQVSQDSTKIIFVNPLGMGFEEEIIGCFNKLQPKWSLASNSSLTFQLSIAFVIDVGTKRVIPSDSSTINVLNFQDPNDLIYTNDDLYRNSFFKDNGSLVIERDRLRQSESTDSSKQFLQELVRRDPLKHFIEY